MVCPSRAVTSSPSIRTEIVLVGIADSLSNSLGLIDSAHLNCSASHPCARKKAQGWGTEISPLVGSHSGAQIATQAAAALFQRLLGTEAVYHFLLCVNTKRGRYIVTNVAAAEARLSGRSAAVLKVREELVPARFAHEPLVHLLRRLLAAAHGIRHVGCAGDHVASGVEVGAAGLVGEAIHNDHSLLREGQSRGLAEVLIEGLAHGQDHAVALVALHLVGGHRPSAPGFVVLAEAGFHDLDGLHMALGIAHNAVRRGEEDKAHALVLGGLRSEEHT